MYTSKVSETAHGVLIMTKASSYKTQLYLSTETDCFYFIDTSLKFDKIVIRNLEFLGLDH